MRYSLAVRSAAAIGLSFLLEDASAARQTSPEPLAAVIVVRHGEKASTGAENPPLSAEGRARAQALVPMLQGAGVTGVVTTQQQRTRQTAAPVAAALHLTPVAVPTAPDAREHARAVGAAVRRLGGTVLVVDHQVAIPGIVAELGGPSVRMMCDVEFSNVYVLIPSGATGMRLIQAHYGAADPPHGPGCRITPRSPP